jgi:hypothetical protein
MLFGIGNYGFSTLDLDQAGVQRTENLLHPGCLASFNLTPTNQEARAVCYEGDRIVPKASSITEETWELTVSQEFVDFTQLQFGLDELAQQSSNFPVPVVKQVRLPLTGPFVITDTDLVAGSNPLAYLSSTNAANPQRLYFEVVGAAPAAANEVQFDDTANTLTFDAALAGLVVQYVVTKTYATIETIGVENEFDRYGALSWVGEISGTENPQGLGVYLPNITRINTPTVDLSGDKIILENTFLVNAPAGGARSVQFFEISTGTEA